MSQAGSNTKVKNEAASSPHSPLSPSAGALSVQVLAAGHEAEVLAFLSSRPVHTVFMAGLIRDNGIESTLNRGSFYGCRNRRGGLEGVALIGHATLVEVRTREALELLAQQARGCARARMIMGEQERVEQFWAAFDDGGRAPRLICRETLFELRWPVEVLKAVFGLRRATLADLPLTMPVHAAMAFEESGVNPLESDSLGFRLRCARRIEQGRVWVLVEGGRLIFKADVISETPEVTYLEGVYVAPEERGRGYGLRCLSQLGRCLLGRAGSICLFANEQNAKAHAFYERAGYKPRGRYDTIFLK